MRRYWLLAVVVVTVMVTVVVVGGQSEQPVTPMTSYTVSPNCAPLGSVAPAGQAAPAADPGRKEWHWVQWEFRLLNE